MQEFADLLVQQGMAKPENITGCTSEEIDEVRQGHGIDRLPVQYEDFLRVMGRQAGELLVGTDFFYPQILELGQDGRKLLAENNAEDLMPPGCLVIGMHQGYEMYWMEPGQPSGRVHWYKETRNMVFQTWPTLLDFLAEEMEEECKFLGNRRQAESAREVPTRM